MPKRVHNSLGSVHKKLCIPRVLKRSFIPGKAELKGEIMPKKYAIEGPSRNGRFWFRTRPQHFWNRRRSVSTLRIVKMRERCHGPKDAIY